jgi:hypothetical protein
MSASTAVFGHVRYKDQLKLMRAETATAWMVAALGWVVEVFTQPLAREFDVGEAPRQRDFPAYY